MGGKIKDIKGQEFGRLTAQYENGRDTCGCVKWHCHCKCGRETDVSGIHLRSGNTRSCGCMILPRYKKQDRAGKLHEEWNKMSPFGKSLEAGLWTKQL